MKTLLSLYLVLAVILAQYFAAYLLQGQDQLSEGIFRHGILRQYLLVRVFDDHK